MKRYTIESFQTNYVLGSFNELEDAICFYHKIARRKFGDIGLIDQTTGEIVKLKKSKTHLAEIAQK